MRRAEDDQGIEDLARRMSALEDQAFAEFSDLFGPKIRGYLIRHGLTPADAEDLAVSCVTDIALKVDKYKLIEGAGFAAWVFTLARHALLDWLRSRQQTSPYIDDMEIEQPIADEPEANLEVTSAVREALATLSESEQAILRLRYFGMHQSFPEIGEDLGLRAGTVRVRHHRAVNRIKLLLKQDARLSKILKRAGIAD